MKIRNRTFKIITLLTLSILMFAIMAVFPLVNNASAEINTTDEYIIRDIQVGDDLSGVTLLIDLTDISQDEIDYWNDTTIVTTDYFKIHYGGVATPLLEIVYNSYEVFSIIYNPDNYTTVTEYVMPQNFGVVTEVNESFTAGIKILALNPGYIPPVEEPEPTEEPENPINEITDFFSNASVAAIILLVLGTFVVYSIIKK
jgi:hypothetical protein